MVEASGDVCEGNHKYAVRARFIVLTRERNGMEKTFENKTVQYKRGIKKRGVLAHPFEGEV
jgi:hypothetical protein